MTASHPIETVGEHVMRDALKLLPLGVGNVRLYVNPQDRERLSQVNAILSVVAGVQFPLGNPPYSHLYIPALRR